MYVITILAIKIHSASDVVCFITPNATRLIQKTDGRSDKDKRNYVIHLLHT